MKRYLIKIACIALFILSNVIITQSVLSTVSADEKESALLTNAQNGKKVYRNEKFGYTVYYPGNWYPSHNIYANAFEIRNYDSKKPESIAERNRATLIIVDTVNENEIVTDKFLKSLLPEESLNDKNHQTVIIDGHNAVRVRIKVPARQLGPGTLNANGLHKGIDKSKFYHDIRTYIDNGKHIIAIEASVPEEADASIVQEIITIEDSVKLN